jgi:hypothetical protein
MPLTRKLNNGGLSGDAALASLGFGMMLNARGLSTIVAAAGAARRA